MWRIAVLACGLLAGCAGPVGYQDAGQRAAALSAFRVGNAKLGCDAGQNCLFQWIHSRPAASRLMQAQRWEDLADVVLAADFDQDLAWYYLGVAAGQLGHTEVARLYLDRAVQRSVIGGLQACQPSCDGFDQPYSAQQAMASLPQPGRSYATLTPRRRPAPRRVARPAVPSAVTPVAVEEPPSVAGAPAGGGAPWVAPVASTP